MLLSLLLGLLAALSWGIHDLLVRLLVKPAQLFNTLFTVLLFGSLLQLPISLWAMQSQWPSSTALAYTGLSGLLYAIAGIALYKAFIIGPVRTVAPIIGAYPLLSVAYTWVAGTPLDTPQVLAVLLLLFAAAYVSSSSSDDSKAPQHKSAIAWSLLAALAFASSFSFGQQASEIANELSLLAANRLASLVVLVLIACALGVRISIAKTQRHWWFLMAFLDTLAHSAVISSGQLAYPVLASVGASLFGLVTITLAAIFLKEKLRVSQWLAVWIVFAAVAYLGVAAQ